MCRRCGADLAEQIQVSQAVTSGKVIAGRYEVGPALGAGGMGVVFAGRDVTLGRDVALKVVLPELASHASAARRIAAEASALARVNHPHVVTLLDAFEHEGLVVLVLELVSGGTLADRIEAGPTPAPEAVWLMTRVLAGLAAIHDLGLVHRDVKPTNILLTATGEPKVTDLGIVYEATRARFTATGAVLGTLAYMAPEQARSRSVDARTDLYAAGVVLFELLSTRLPFPAEQDGAWWRRTSSAEPANALLPADTPPELVRVIGCALATDLDARYPNARAMAAALAQSLGQPPAPALHRPDERLGSVVEPGVDGRTDLPSDRDTLEPPATQSDLPVPAGAAPPPSPVVAPAPPAPNRNRAALVVTVVLAAIVLVPVVGIGAFIGLYAILRGQHVLRGPVGGQTYVRPFCDDLCWVQANSDGVEDLATWSGGWDRAHVVVIDGATGKGLWSSPSVPHLADSFLHCSDPATVVVSHKDFSAYAYDASTGHQRWRATLSDQARRSAPGDGCLVLETSDHQTTGLSLATGAPQNCEPHHKPANFRDRGPARAKQTMHIGGLDIALTERSEGTPMLALTASRAEVVVWRTELGVYTNSPYAMAGKIAAAGSVIAVGGRVPANDIRVRLVGVSATTGTMLWSREYGDAAAVDFVESRAGRFYVGLAGSVRLIDPATGRDLWQATEP